MSWIKRIGVFWTPGNEKEQYSGELVLDKKTGCGRLRLILPTGRGSFLDNRQSYYQIIQGRTTEGICTLGHCQFIHGKGRGPSERVAYVLLRFDFFLAGIFLSSTSESLITGVTASFTWLDQWVAIPAFTGRSLRSRIRMGYKERPLVTGIVDNSLRFKLLLTSTAHHSRRADRKGVVTQQVVFSIQSSENQTLEYFLNVLRVLQDFLATSMLHLSLPTDIWFTTLHDEAFPVDVS